MKPQLEKLINELATKLARNLVSISFKKGEETDEAASEILDLPEIGFEPERFIVVIGAGASKHANVNIPLGKESIKKLKDDFGIGNSKVKKAGFKGLKKLFQEEIVELSQVYRLEETDFETVLLALSKYFPKDIYKKLANYYGYRYYPDGFYELLAHLFKNRFVDAIINFNFDELLDQAIEDEIGSSAYQKVLFDGDLPDYNNEVIKDDHFQRPFYVKPHGTFSHKSSMRFTRRDYFNISSDIDVFLGTLLSGKLNTINNIKVNLLVFGFNLESFEFINLLKKELPKGSNVYIFDKSHEGIYSKEIETPKGKRIKTHYIPWDTEDYEIDKILIRLYSAIDKKFKTGYKPDSIKRHISIARLFKYEKAIQRSPVEDINYFKDRIYIELSLQIAKSKGFISLQQLSLDRTGRYYNLYKKYTAKLANAENSICALPLYKFCENLGLVKYAYSREFYRLHGKVNGNEEKITVSENEFEDFLQSLSGKLEKAGVSREVIQIIETENQSNNSQQKVHLDQDFSFYATLREMFKAEDSEYCQKDKDLHDNIFKNPVEINTKLAFNYETIKMFNEPLLSKWDYFLSIAETGEWLWKKAEINKESNKKIRLIVADNAFKNKLLDKFSNNLPDNRFDNVMISVEHLNWWLHNQHMSLFLKKDDNNEKGYSIFKAIYFTRKSKSNLITPVILNEDEDKELALEIFIAYSIKAQNEKKNPGSLKVDSESVEKFNKEYLDELLSR